ncbi:MAG: VIT1/CCC1 transporter family protein, partial [Candidatus Thorarchaeota archaeon]
EEEKEEVKEIFEKMGIKGQTLDACVESITSNKQVWIDFLTKSELGLEEPENPILGAILTFLAFVFGSFLTLLAYLFDLGLVSLVLSSIISFSMLYIVGALKTKITGENKIRSGLEMVLIGIVAFVASFGIGTVLDQLIATA